MNCANCGKEIYWDHKAENWHHVNYSVRACGFDGYAYVLPIRYATPKIEDSVLFCKHCGKPIVKSKVGDYWVHFVFGERICHVNGKSYDVEPEHDLIILDEVKPKEVILHCNNCEYGKNRGKRWYCHPGSGIYEVYIGTYSFDAVVVPPAWCPKKAKEPEDLCLAIFGNPIVVCQLSKGHAGKHEGRRRDLIYSWNDYDSESLGELMKNTPSDLDTKPDTSSLEIRPMPQPNMQKGETIDKVADLFNWIDELRQMIGKYGYDIVAKKG